jgi:hypothetical protein
MEEVILKTLERVYFLLEPKLSFLPLFLFPSNNEILNPLLIVGVCSVSSSELKRVGSWKVILEGGHSSGATSKNLDSIRIKELIGSLQTYKFTLPQPRKNIFIALKTMNKEASESRMIRI